MKISLKDLRACLDIAADMEARYQSYTRDGANPRKSRDDIHHVAEERLGAEIEIFELLEKLEHETTIGFYVAEDSGYSICISAGLDEDELRYVVCKELMHVLLDAHDKEYRSTDICGHLDGFALSFLATDTTPDKSVLSEHLAEIAAMELLFPYADRKKELADGKPDYPGLAEKYGVPQYQIERYLHPITMEEIGAMMRNGN